MTLFKIKIKLKFTSLYYISCDLFSLNFDAKIIGKKRPKTMKALSIFNRSKKPVQNCLIFVFTFCFQVWCRVICGEIYSGNEPSENQCQIHVCFWESVQNLKKNHHKTHSMNCQKNKNCIKILTLTEWTKQVRISLWNCSIIISKNDSFENINQDQLAENPT